MVAIWLFQPNASSVPINREVNGTKRENAVEREEKFL